MEKFIIDTNFFFNLQIKTGFGESPKEVISGFTLLARELKTAKKAEFFMPPRVLDELYTFIPPDDAVVQELLTVVTIKSPDISKVNFASSVFYKLIEDIRERSYRGMKVAEEIIDQAASAMVGKNELSKVDYQKAVGEHLARLRDRYRQATRVKFLDSVADLDLIVLSCELDGTLVSADEGVLLWGREFGVREIDPKLVRQTLQSL